MAQAARLATEQVEAAVHAAEESFKEGNTLDATAKAAVAAWRSSQVRSPSSQMSHPLRYEQHLLMSSR